MGKKQDKYSFEIASLEGVVHIYARGPLPTRDLMESMIYSQYPDAEIFEHAHKLVGLPSKQRVLMVGDNPHSDILGGLDFGIETCWLNSQEKAIPAGINPHYQVKSLADLQALLLA